MRQRLRTKLFVQSMTTIVTPPNLPAHKPTGNCASGNDERPHMPTGCHYGTMDESKGEGGYHRSIDPLEVRAVQNVLMPLIGLHDAGAGNDDKTEKQKRGDDHVSILPKNA